MIELDDDTVQAIREGALPGVRFCRDSWDHELLFEAPETLEEYRRLERPEIARIEADLGSTMSSPPERAAPVERAPRRRRKPSLDKLIAKAKAAGATSVLVDGVEMRFGNAASGNGAATDVDRELAEFEARHEA
jgi:hypothetical protein